ncbi:MAG: hypothetical protein AAGF11_25925 [Myxococcota bacterium]
MNVSSRALGALALVVSLACVPSGGAGAPASSPTLATPAPAEGVTRASRSLTLESAMSESAMSESAMSESAVSTVSLAPAVASSRLGQGAESAPVEPSLASANAQLLAGLSAKAQWLDATEAARLERHATRADKNFDHFGRKVGEPMARWAEQTLAHEDGETIFYPFSGPDFATVHRLYPRAGRYVLVAMQKAGVPPQLSDMAAEDRRTTFELHGQIMHNFAHMGFFVTKKMNERFHHELPNAGLTGTLMIFAEREGFAIDRVEPITVDEHGEVVVHPGDRAQAQTWHSVRLHLRRRTNGQAVTLDYLRLNLADWNLRKHEGQRRFVHLMSGHRTLLKAASHLLQQRYGFAEIRDAILDNAPSVLQDETGLPYAKLAQGHQVRLFGQYQAPHMLFDADPQVPLAQAYQAQADSVEALPFRIGYRKVAGSCLQYAERDVSAEHDMSAEHDASAS